MNDFHSNWPLFTGDLKFAQAWIQDQNELLRPKQSQLLHSALSLGLIKEVKSLLNRQSAKISPSIQRAIRFRITRFEGGDYYPWLFTPETIKELKYKWNLLVKNSNQPVRIAFQGGIGDHLQDLSLIIPYFKGHSKQVIAHLNNTRDSQLNRIAKENLITTNVLLNKKNGFHVSEIMKLLGHPLPIHQEWINISAKMNNKKNRLLFCWNAYGSGDSFSCWSRSVSFTDAINFYKRLIYKGWEPQEITDISNWKSWELNSLLALGIKHYNPSRGDLLDLARLSIASKHIITIDTALVHLCASLGKKNILFLPSFNDERWPELLRTNSCYEKNCVVYKQKYFGNWQQELEDLFLNLIQSR